MKLTTEIQGKKMSAFYIQIGLIIIYLILAGLFGFKKSTWPLSLYYIGCFVKDAGVFILAMWKLK